MKIPDWLLLNTIFYSANEASLRTKDSTTPVATDSVNAESVTASCPTWGPGSNIGSLVPNWAKGLFISSSLMSPPIMSSSLFTWMMRSFWRCRQATYATSDERPSKFSTVACQQRKLPTHVHLIRNGYDILDSELCHMSAQSNSEKSQRHSNCFAIMAPSTSICVS